MYVEQPNQLKLQMKDLSAIEQAFVLPHARALPACKNKTSDLAAASHKDRVILRPDPFLGQSIAYERN